MNIKTNPKKASSGDDRFGFTAEGKSILASKFGRLALNLSKGSSGVRCSHLFDANCQSLIQRCTVLHPFSLQK